MSAAKRSLPSEFPAKFRHCEQIEAIQTKATPKYKRRHCEELLRRSRPGAATPPFPAASA
jgi:hypothetical protein